MSFASSIYEKGAALENVWNFVNGTLRSAVRSVQNQRVTYKGHKRKHGLKYLSRTTPNGTIRNLFGPVEGRRHDGSMHIRYNACVKKLFNWTKWREMGIYGDPE